MKKVITIEVPEALRDAVRKKLALQGLTLTSVIVSFLWRYVGRVELPDSVDESDAWPSGWPKIVKCNRCNKLHDPMEHAVNAGMVGDAQAMAKRMIDSGT